MKTIFRSLLRFKAATLMNVVGLSIAFASFLIIMMQVKYELGYDSGYSTAETLYRIDVQKAPGDNLEPGTTSLLGGMLDSVAPSVQATAFRQNQASDILIYDVGQGVGSSISALSYSASGSLPRVLGLTLLSGSFENFNRQKTALLAESVARKAFGDENPVGKTIVAKSSRFSDTLEIVALYRDLPRNSSVINGLIMHAGDYKGSKGNWSYITYLLIPFEDQIPQLEKTASDYLKSIVPWFFDKTPEEHVGIRISKLSDRYFSPLNNDAEKGNKTSLYSMIAIAGLILLVAVINFINFSMALIPRKIKSINTRKVLGSTRLSLQLGQLGETLGITLIALGLACFLVYSLSTTSFAALIDADMRLSVNGSLLWLISGIALLSAVVATLYPALYSTSFAPALILKGSFGLSSQGRSLRTGLIGFQYVVSLALIIIAFFIQLQYNYMREFDPGYRKENILTTTLTAPIERQKNAFTDKLNRHPDIVDVAYSSTMINRVESSATRRYKDQTFSFGFIRVTPNFNSVMGIPILEGRDFLPSDELTGGTYVFNRAAQEKWGFETETYMQGEEWKKVPAKIVGFAPDFNFMPLHYAIEPLGLYVIGPEEKRGWGPLSVTYVKTTGKNPGELMHYIRNTMLEFDPEAGALANVEFLDDSLGGQYKKESKLASLIMLFSLLAMLISTVGAFGLVMFETQYRRKEIGIRKVFGATVRDVLRMFNKRYICIVAVCFVIASPLAYYAAVRWQGNFAYQAPVASWIFLAALLIVLLITVATVTLQSYRAATENPANSVKAE